MLTQRNIGPDSILFRDLFSFGCGAPSFRLLSLETSATRSPGIPWVGRPVAQPSSHQCPLAASQGAGPGVRPQARRGVDDCLRRHPFAYPERPSRPQKCRPLAGCAALAVDGRGQVSLGCGPCCPSATLRHRISAPPRGCPPTFTPRQPPHVPGHYVKGAVWRHACTR